MSDGRAASSGAAVLGGSRVVRIERQRRSAPLDRALVACAGCSNAHGEGGCVCLCEHVAGSPWMECERGEDV